MLQNNMKSNLIRGLGCELKLLGKFNDQETYGRLTSIKGSEAISELFEYELILITQNQNITQQVLCGLEIICALTTNHNSESQNQRYINGIIQEVSFTKNHNPKESVNPAFEYRLVVVPKLKNMTKIKHSRVFYGQNQKLLDVIKKILNEHNITDLRIDTKNQNYFIAETCIQYNESDYAFFYRLLNIAGLYFFFIHDNEKHTLVISDRENLYFKLQCEDIKVVSPKNKLFSLYSISSQYSLHTTAFNLNAFAYSDRTKIINKKYSASVHSMQKKLDNTYEDNVYICETKDLNQVSLITEASAQSSNSSAIKITGEGSYPCFAVGGKFSFCGNFFQDLPESEYVITKMSFKVYNYISKEQQYINAFEAIPANQIMIPPQSCNKPIIQGLHFALVVDEQGASNNQEPCCDEKGRIYIKLLWGSDNLVCKANVLSASNGFTLPRVGSLAYVMFPYNNLYNDFPVVVGISNEDLLHLADKGDQHKNLYKVSPGSSDESIYNFICFDDTKDKQKINVVAKKDLFIDVKHDKNVNIQNIRSVTIEEGNDILNVNKGDILINVKQGKYNITCKGDATISSDNNIQINSKGNIDFNADGNITLSAQKDMSISAQNVLLKSLQNITNEATSGSITHKAATSISITSNAQVSVSSTVTEVKGQANVSISSPMTKISM